MTPKSPRRFQDCPKSARDGPRRPQIQEKKRPQSETKPNPLQTSFLERFCGDLGRFSGGFGMVLAIILEAWGAILRFTETARNNTKPHEKVSKRSQEASNIEIFTIVKRAHRASGRSERSELSTRSKRLPDGSKTGKSFLKAAIAGF